MKIDVTSKINIDANKTLEKRGLGNSRGAAKVIASEVKRLCGDFVPMQKGTLKNTAMVVEADNGVCVLYNQPYAHYQYYGEVMAGPAPKSYTGRAIQYSGAPQRGKEWDKRMMAARGHEVSGALAKYVGGKVVK